MSDCSDYLIVLALSKDGEFFDVYNGPGEPVWEKRGKPQKTSQFQIALSKLRVLAAGVPSEKRIARVM